MEQQHLPSPMRLLEILRDRFGALEAVATNKSNGVIDSIQWGESVNSAGEPLFVVSVNQWSPANGWWIGTAVPGTGSGQGAGSGYGLWNPTNYTQHALQSFTMTQTP